MKKFAMVLAAAGLLMAGAAQASPELAEKSGCNKCHAMDAKKMGPSYKDIAAKNKADAADKITANLKDGKGHPKVAASDAEIKQMVMFMITGK